MNQVDKEGGTNEESGQGHHYDIQDDPEDAKMNDFDGQDANEPEQEEWHNDDEQQIGDDVNANVDEHLDQKEVKCLLCFSAENNAAYR